MPYIVHGEDTSVTVQDPGNRNYNYEYPNGIDLRPSSETHRRILTRLLQYAMASGKVSAGRFQSYREIDEKLTGYIPASEEERRVQSRDRRKPISIVFPYSYAIMETLVAYLVAAFLPEPLFRYEGVGPEDTAGALLLQQLINTHAIRNKVALNLHTMFRDSTAYGFSVVSPQWTVKTGKRIVKRNTTAYDQAGRGYEIEGDRAVIDTVLYEGNSLINIDPYCYLPDPNVPIHDPQRGEFVGWLDRTNYVNLLSDENLPGSDLFNVKYLQHVQMKSTTVLGSRLNERAVGRNTHYDVKLNRGLIDPIDQLHMYVKLIPKQWRLGTSENPEKWLFTVAADSVIIRAQPLGLYHDLFPAAVSAPDFDGYSPVAYSRLEILKGMQTTVDWLFNSHIANVRKVINDVLIVDPYMININDLANPGPGGLVRLRRPAWGKGVKDAVMQLNVTDITRQNIADVSAIIQYMQTIGGTDNTVMGSLREGGPDRLSAQEFRGTAQGAVSRLERIAKMIGIQAMQDIGYMFACHAQQLMSRGEYVRTIGEWPQVIAEQFDVQNGRVLVEPDDILIEHDIIVRDGSIPGGSFSDTWTQLFQTIGNSPALLQRFDIVRIFEYIATQLGAKNVADFRIQQVQATTLPDEEVLREVERGNLLPAG